jgi:hypothetical protein
MTDPQSVVLKHDTQDVFVPYVQSQADFRSKRKQPELPLFILPSAKCNHCFPLMVSSRVNTSISGDPLSINLLEDRDLARVLKRAFAHKYSANSRFTTAPWREARDLNPAPRTSVPRGQ